MPLTPIFELFNPLISTQLFEFIRSQAYFKLIRWHSSRYRYNSSAYLLLRPICTKLSLYLIVWEVFTKQAKPCTWAKDYFVDFSKDKHSYGNEDSKIYLIIKGSFFNDFIILIVFIHFSKFCLCVIFFCNFYAFAINSFFTLLILILASLFFLILTSKDWFKYSKLDTTLKYLWNLLWICENKFIYTKSKSSFIFYWRVFIYTRFLASWPKSRMKFYWKNT